MGRLRRTGALLMASRRRNEVVEVVGQAETDDEAVEAVSELLGVEPDHAAEVVDMPVKGFTNERVKAREEEVERLEERLHELRAELP
jgi:cyanate lyase